MSSQDRISPSAIKYKGTSCRIKLFMSRFTFEQKRYMTVAAFSLRMLCMGIEFAVIFPSVWLYLKIFHVDYWYLGLVLSAYNMVGVISTVIVGHLADSTRKIRFFGFLWNVTEIVGNIVYALPFHMTLPLIGRMVAGFGEGYISAMWGELARITTKEQRTRYFAILKGSNLLGAAIGPAFNLFLREFDFSIGAWRIDFRTSPGFFMGLVWVVVTVIMLLFVTDLSSELAENPEQYELLSQQEDSVVELKEKLAGNIPQDENANEQTNTSTFRAALEDMFTKCEVIVLVYLLFFMYVTHTCLQGITPLVAENMLNWDETRVSILYTAWGLEIILVLAIVWIASYRIPDRVILLSAVICGSLSSVTLIMLSYSKPGTDFCLYSLLATILLAGVGISVTVVVGRSLVSKHTNPANQGLVHAILTAFNRLAGLSGPIFGSSLYTHKTLMGILVACVQFFGLFLVLVVFSRLKHGQEKTTVNETK